MNDAVRGHVLKYGDNISTDILIPSRHLTKFLPPEQIAEHCMEPIDPDFHNKVKPGDILVAGKNFGCGSSREEAVVGLVYNKVGAVIAESFGRIFYRNATNRGDLLLIQCPDIGAFVENGDEVEIKLEQGLIKNLTRNQEIKFKPIPAFIMDILKSGGLIASVKRMLEESSGM